jgi:hypothetical protein
LTSTTLRPNGCDLAELAGMNLMPTRTRRHESHEQP